MNLLLVEDDYNLGEILKAQLENTNISVILCSTGKECLEHIYSGENIDIIILDWMLPDISGIDVLNQLFFDKISIPTIMLTALDTLQHKTSALSKGADDYIVKPFEFDELLARINALYRRTNQTKSFEYTYKDIIYLIDCKTIKCADLSIQLTNRESQLFELLLKSPEHLVTQDEIIEAVWGINSDVGNGNILNYIYFLRNRLKTIHSSVTIKTVYGSGYILTFEEKTK